MSSRHDKVEKISNTIYRPCSGLALKHNVKFASKNKEGKRNLYHSEYEYSSSAYIDAPRLVTIKLSYSSYLTLEEEGKDWNDREGIMIGYGDLYYIKRKFKEVERWFTEYTDLYLEDKDRIVMNSKYKGLRVNIRNLPGNKLILIIPGVMQLDDGSDYECACLFMNNKEKRFDIMMDRFLALTDILSGFNLYLAGQEIVNYLGRPDLGEYSHSFNKSGSPKGVSKDSVFSKGVINKRKNNGFNSL